MVVGVCRLLLLLPENGDLKGKRRLAQSITSRVRNRFPVAIAEVEDNDLWQRLTLGVSCVGNNARHVNAVLSRVVSFVQQMKGDAEFLDYELEIIPAL
ncbi:MAG: DUF503 domain-containing protein [Dehalococcoidia bacterium]